jgi:hypothetical protein
MPLNAGFRSSEQDFSDLLFLCQSMDGLNDAANPTTAAKKIHDTGDYRQ